MKDNSCKIFFSIFILLLSFSGFSQVTTITGSAAGAEGKIIRLVAPMDLITFVEKELTRDTVDATGQFTFSAPMKTPVLASLNIDFHRVELYLEPGKSYFIKCAPMNYKEITDMNPLIHSQSIQVEFINSDNDDLNFLTAQFNVMYNKFILDNFNALYRDRQKAKLDSFRVEIVTSFLETRNFYFATYIRYKLASLEQLAQVFSGPQIAKKYFMDSPILYENTEYMDFFNQFFSKYLTVTSKAIKFTDYPKIITTINSYPAMMRILEQDTILRKPQLRELVLLKGLMEMFNMPGYNQESILSLLETISKESKFPDNRVVAEDMNTFLTRLRKGTPAPPFTLYDRDKKAVSLKDFKGKPVLISFWTTYCQNCLTEMDLLKPVYDKYKDKISFISISADHQYQKMLYFIMMKKEYSWTFLHIGDQLQLLKDYDVQSYPLYVLVDSRGNIFKYPASLPGNGLESLLEMVISP